MDSLTTDQVWQSNLVFYASWNTHEEFGLIVILERDGTYWIGHDGHCVMASPPQTAMAFTPISEDECMDEMVEWADDEDDDMTISDVVETMKASVT